MSIEHQLQTEELKSRKLKRWLMGLWATVPIVVVGAVLLILISPCLCCWGITAIGSVMPTPTPAPTWMPSDSENPWKTVAQIETEIEGLTDLQREAYEDELVGQTVRFEGSVTEVYGDGEVLIDDGTSLWTTVRLTGLSHDTAMSIQQGSLLSGEGVVTDVSQVFGLSLEIQVTSLD